MFNLEAMTDAQRRARSYGSGQGANSILNGFNRSQSDFVQWCDDNGFDTDDDDAVAAFMMS